MAIKKFNSFFAGPPRSKNHLTCAGPARWKNHPSCAGPARWKNHLSSAGPARADLYSTYINEMKVKLVAKIAIPIKKFNSPILHALHHIAQVLFIIIARSSLLLLLFI